MIHTITADNGKEFAKHQEIAKELDISFYFCKPYHSWERGANENSPQKRLGYLTPNEKFNLLLTNQNSGYICKLNSPNQRLYIFFYFSMRAMRIAVLRRFDVAVCG